MEAVFFRVTREQAATVRSADDLEDDPSAEPLRVGSPGAFVVLAEILCGPGRRSLEQLRDATCQSFPVWSLSEEVVDALGALADHELDGVAETWLAKAGGDELDADLYELSTFLTDLRTALGTDTQNALGNEPENASGADSKGKEQLFVLFEEKAL